jgi:hypothetical protein
MNRSLAVAIPTCSDRREDIRIGYVLEALAMQAPSPHFDSLDIYIWDEGSVPMTADRWVQLAMDLVVRRGHTPTYLRRGSSQGVAEARRNLIAAVPITHDRILLLDDDLLPMPGALTTLLDAAAQVGRFGFIQGTKIELDTTRTYHNDINQLTAQGIAAEPRALWFGDAAFLLVSRSALAHVRWDVVSRFTEKGLPGEDVAMTLMIADREPCYGSAAAAGYHLSLATPRWRWEVPSDLLQIELLRAVVTPETLQRALPHLAKYLGGNSQLETAGLAAPPKGPGGQSAK